MNPSWVGVNILPMIPTQFGVNKLSTKVITKEFHSHFQVLSHRKDSVAQKFIEKTSYTFG
jgi:hypothetical protein